MIQLKPVLLPAAGDGCGEEQTMLPDAILHPRFAQRKPGKGLWFCADQMVYERLRQRQLHRQVAPEAKISPRLGSLITRQLQQRVVQEAELLYERVRTRTLGDAGPNKHAAAVLDLQATAAPARQMRAGGIPLYHVAAMLGDADLHAALGEWLTQIVERSSHACTRCHEGMSLAQHPRTSALAVALWRLASWTDSKEPLG